MKFNGSKIKMSRSLGIPLTPKAQKYHERRSYPPGQHGQRKRRKLSSGLARTIHQSRQLFGHGHIQVNGKKVDIASARLKPGDLVSVGESSRSKRVFNDRLAGAVPSYVEVRDNGYEAVPLRLPEHHEVPVICDPQLVVEHHSR